MHDSLSASMASLKIMGTWTLRTLAPTRKVSEATTRVRSSMSPFANVAIAGPQGYEAVNDPVVFDLNVAV